MKIYAGSTVLVTGSTGLIGSTLVHALMKENNVKVIAMSRSKENLHRCFSCYSDNKHFISIAQDTAQPFQLDEPVHYIFHAAGPIAGKIIRQEPLQVIEPNLLGLRNCLELLKRQKECQIDGRLIVFSSATVYGSRCGEHCTVQENDTMMAEVLHTHTAAYSESKRMAEVLALAYARQWNLDVVIARFSYVYGCSKIEPATAFYSLINKAVQGNNITILNPVQNMVDYIYNIDAVNGVLYVGAYGSSSEAYNISSNGELGNYSSMDQIAKKIIEKVNSLCNRPVSLVLPEGGVERVEGIKMDNSKLKGLGWNLTTKLEDGILQVIQSKYKTLTQ